MPHLPYQAKMSVGAGLRLALLDTLSSRQMTEIVKDIRHRQAYDILHNVGQAALAAKFQAMAGVRPSLLPFKDSKWLADSGRSFICVYEFPTSCREASDVASSGW